MEYFSLRDEYIWPLKLDPFIQLSSCQQRGFSQMLHVYLILNCETTGCPLRWTPRKLKFAVSPELLGLQAIFSWTFSLPGAIISLTSCPVRWGQTDQLVAGLWRVEQVISRKISFRAWEKTNASPAETPECNISDNKTSESSSSHQKTIDTGFICPSSSR